MGHDQGLNAPLTGSPYASVRTGSFFLQVIATIRRQIVQKSRAKISLLLEVCLPIAFAALLAWVASLADSKVHESEQYVKENRPPNNITAIIADALCYNGPTDSHLFSVLGGCDRTTKRLTCNVNTSETYATTIPDDVCGINLDYVAPYVQVTVPRFDEDLQLINFDTFVKMQWIIRIFFGDAPSSVFEGDSNLISLRASGNLFFVPSSSAYVQDLVTTLNTSNALFRYIFGGFAASRDSLLPFVKSVEGEGKTWAIIEANENKVNPNHVSFCISINRTAVPNTKTLRNPFSLGLGERPYGSYYASGFLTLEQTLGNYFLQSLNASLPSPATGSPTEEVISFAPMGYAEYTDNTFFTVAGRVAPLMQTLSFLYTVSQLSKRLVEEKEQRLREGTMIMGLTRAAFFCSWMLVYYVQVFVTTTATSVILSLWLLKKTVFPLTFFLYALFGVSVVNVSALLSTFFNKSRIAALVVPLLYFMISIPSFALPDGTEPGTYVLLSWLPTIPFSIGNILLFNYETTNGLPAADLASSDDRPYNMAACYAFLLFNVICCPLLMLYLDAVLPKEWGTRRHPLYCFGRLLPRCLGGSKGREDSAIDYLADNEADATIGTPAPYMKLETAEEAAAVDAYPAANGATTIHIRGVRKEFSTPAGKKVAVDGIDLRLFPGMVTVLLGHNGAGKTTLMNMMTGMLDMSAGDVSVYGVSVHDSLNAVRRNVGYCPQHNILWDDLTCIEHLRYFARLKGVPSKLVESEALRLLERVDLLDKKDVFSRQLSGGQKRKLSVAIAFIGGSQLILLDEPTAGMDVSARRHTWEIIREMAADRTILLTTHFMDEADLLGSRIAIMSKGRLHSYGSPMFLKTKLGSGYVLRVSCTHTVTDGGAAILAEAKVMIPDAALKEVKGQEVAMVLHTSDAPKFPAILRRFEEPAIKSKHSISGVSMTVSTLEDVFLSIAEAEEHENHIPDDADSAAAAGIDPAAKAGNLSPITAGINGSKSRHETEEEVAIRKAFETLEASYGPAQSYGTGNNSTNSATSEEGKGRQLVGLIVKRFHYARRDNRTIFFQLAMPLLCLILAMLLGFLGPGTPPQLWIDEGMYGDKKKQLVSINNGEGISAFYSGKGSAYVTDDVVLNSTYAFSNYLVDTYNSNGDRERFTSVARSAKNFYPARDDKHTFTTIFTNSSVPHSAPEGLRGYYLNAARQSVAAADPNADTGAIRFDIASFPLPFTERQNDQIDAVKHLFMALFVLIPFTFIPSTYVAYIVKERECKAKHLQFVSGVRFSIYWTSNFIFDILAYTFTTICAMIIFAIFGREEFVGSSTSTLCTASVLMLYGVSGICAAYAISFLFSSHSTAQNVVMIVNFVIGFCLVMATYIMTQIESTKGVMSWLVYFFRVFPAFCLGEGIMNIAITGSTNKILKEDKSLFAMDVTGGNLLFMAFSSFIYALITLIVDHPKRKEKQRMLGFNAGATAPLPDDGEEDEDVIAERRAVEQNARPDDVIVVKGLRKVYPLGIGKEKVAVQNITFGVKPGEVFGFLGTNGAGKTTTMGVLTGEFVPTMGEATVAGFDVVREAQEAFKVIGYCPQFDALLDLLTPTEHLNLYASLRGVPRAQSAAIVDALIVACGLSEFRKIPAMRLSGGNKRKLSVAVSLMGNPKLVFLDEPSAGMDPSARRQLWDVIVFVAKRSSVLLTTHHLEEVDVLAHRVGIMDKGLMKCMGTLEHLKSKFGGGFELTLRVSDASFEAAAAAHVAAAFPEAALVESREQRLVFALAAGSTSLADLFEAVQSAQRDASLGISDYIVQQSSLENVFLKITAEAAAEEALEKHQTVAAEGAAAGDQQNSQARTSVIDLDNVQPATAGAGYAAILRGSAVNRNTNSNNTTAPTSRVNRPTSKSAASEADSAHAADDSFSPREEQ